MNNENNLNEIIKSKFSETEHPFDEGSWKAMRTMIDESRARKKRTIWLSSAAALLLCAGGAFGIYEWNNQGVKSENGPKITASNTMPVSSEKNNKPVSNSSTPAVSPSPNISSGNNAGNAANNKAIVANQATGNSKMAVAVNTNAQSPTIGKSKKHKTKSINSVSAASKKEIASINKILDELEQNSKTEDVLSMKETSPNSSLTPAQLPVNSTPPIVPKTPPPPVAKVNTKAPDTASSLPQRFSDEPRIFNGEKQMFSIEAGTYYSPGWSPGLSITQGSGWNYVIGVGYTHYLKSKIFVKTGIQFSDLGHMSSYSYNYESTSPQNANIISDSVITTKRLYYLSIPLQFEFFCGQHKSSGGFGGSASYLLTTTTTASTFQQYENTPPVNINNYSKGIHLNGYNKWSATFYGFYRFTYNRHFSLYGMLYFMTPVENETFFAEDKYLYNTGFKLLFSYTL